MCVYRLWNSVHYIFVLICKAKFSIFLWVRKKNLLQICLNENTIRTRLIYFSLCICTFIWLQRRSVVYCNKVLKWTNWLLVNILYQNMGFYIFTCFDLLVHLKYSGDRQIEPQKGVVTQDVQYQNLKAAALTVIFCNLNYSRWQSKWRR